MVNGSGSGAVGNGEGSSAGVLVGGGGGGRRHLGRLGIKNVDDLRVRLTDWLPQLLGALTSFDCRS